MKPATSSAKRSLPSDSEHSLSKRPAIEFSIVTQPHSQIRETSDLYKRWIDNIFSHSSASLLGQRGEIKQKKGDYLGALADYNASLAIEPNVKYFIQRGIIRRELKIIDYSNSLADFNEALRLEPDNIMALGQSACTKLVGYDTYGALADLKRGLLLAPTNEFLLIQHNAFQDSVNKLTASTYYSLEELKSPPAVLLAARSMSQRNSGWYQAALRDIDAAIFLTFNNDAYYNERAIIKQLMKDYSGALSDHEIALRAKPQNPYYLAQRGITHMHLNNLPEALNDLSMALEKEVQKDHPFLLCQLAIVKRLSGDYEGAWNDLIRVYLQEPTNSLALSELGLNAKAMGHYSDALIFFEQALALLPNNSALIEERAQINNLMDNCWGPLLDLNIAEALSCGEPSIVEQTAEVTLITTSMVESIGFFAVRDSQEDPLATPAQLPGGPTFNE